MDPLTAGARWWLVNWTYQIVFVAGRVDVEELREGLARPARYRCGLCAQLRLDAIPRIPSDVLLRFCARLPGLRIAGQSIVKAASLRDPLSPVHRVLVEGFRRHGGVMRIADVLQCSGHRGIDRGYAKALLSWAPYIKRVGRGTFALRGENSLVRR
jgi:hypothetical protein